MSTFPVWKQHRYLRIGSVASLRRHICVTRLTRARIIECPLLPRQRTWGRPGLKDAFMLGPRPSPPLLGLLKGNPGTRPVRNALEPARTEECHRRHCI